MTTKVISGMTVEEALSSNNPGSQSAALSMLQAGRMLSLVKVAFAGLTSGTTFDITTAALKALATVTGLKLDADETLPAIGKVCTLRVVTGTATGHRNVTDVGGTPSASLATISDDGKTLVFEAAITAFTITYEPRGAVPGDTAFNFASP